MRFLEEQIVYSKQEAIDELGGKGDSTDPRRRAVASNKRVGFQWFVPV